ncbi:hypothetical protein PILCRDRAFT_257053 [Piloderma croceum F 1598]|uniref:Secreted protein n=1 Tax=Piloderma croceum (strain F 1598) TaxID=765440 RepID=A0A0C3CFC8_PILCF|nr:hypothetical protein PILCRDRAFT_257053 [Piloderma croceum F 1598]
MRQVIVILCLESVLHGAETEILICVSIYRHSQPTSAERLCYHGCLRETKQAQPGTTMPATLQTASLVGK